MKKCTFIISLLVLVNGAFAQNYNIGAAAPGDMITLSGPPGSCRAGTLLE